MPLSKIYVSNTQGEKYWIGVTQPTNFGTTVLSGTGAWTSLPNTTTSVSGATTVTAEAPTHRLLIQEPGLTMEFQTLFLDSILDLFST